MNHFITNLTSNELTVLIKEPYLFSSRSKSRYYSNGFVCCIFDPFSSSIELIGAFYKFPPVGFFRDIFDVISFFWNVFRSRCLCIDIERDKGNENKDEFFQNIKFKDFS